MTEEEAGESTSNCGDLNKASERSTRRGLPSFPDGLCLCGIEGEDGTWEIAEGVSMVGCSLFRGVFVFSLDASGCCA